MQIYDPSTHPRQARHLCTLGATNDELAEFFQVDPSTIDRWIARHEEFRRALKVGKAVPDSRVERSLYNRAVGYSHTDTKIFLSKDGEIITHEYIKHIPPNVPACIFWLKNRIPKKWRDAHKFDVEYDSKNIVEVMKKVAEKLPV